MVAACGGGGGFPADAPIEGPPPGGNIALTWSLTDTNGQPIECGQVGGQVVTLVLRNRNVLGASTEVFTCSSLGGTTPLVAPGIYDIDFELRGTVGLLTMGGQQQGVIVTSSQTTELAPVTFAVDATGGLDLDLTTGKPGGNCKPTSEMGAGITSTTITLVHTGGGCEPVTFDISAGASDPAGAYVVNCTSPAVAPCIETDQKLTVATMPSGTYEIHVRGQIAGVDCYANDDGLTVPPLAKVLRQTLGLAQQTTPGC